MRFALKLIKALGAALSALGLILISSVLVARSCFTYYAHRMSPDCNLDIESQLAARIGEETLGRRLKTGQRGCPFVPSFSCWPSPPPIRAVGSSSSGART